MARNGNVALTNLIVSKVVHTKTASMIVASKAIQGQQYTVTVETSGAFPDGMDLRPDDAIDMTVAYDQKVKA